MSDKKKKDWVESAAELLEEGGEKNNMELVAEEMFEQYEGMTPEQAIAEELPYLAN